MDTVFDYVDGRMQRDEVIFSTYGPGEAIAGFRPGLSGDEAVFPQTAKKAAGVFLLHAKEEGQIVCVEAAKGSVRWPSMTSRDLRVGRDPTQSVCRAHQ